MTKAKKPKAKRKRAEAPRSEGDLDEKLRALEAERDDLLGRLQRTAADYLNYQKRSARQADEARQYARAELIKQLLPVLDDMERALGAARENHAEDDPLLAGMQLVHDKALETLGRLGLAVIEAVGKPFDPDRHSAVMQQDDHERPPQTILQEVQKGYEINGRTLRPAAVVVSKEPETARQDSPDQQSPDGNGAENGE